MQPNENEGQRQGTTYSKANASPATTADRARVLEFLREREREVLEIEAYDIADPRAHDAVSADEVAVHLGWMQSDGAGKPRANVERAARALEQLCADGRVVCFSRPRMRRGESGEIRLYCTAQHLEGLTRLIEEPEPSTAV